ncbi:hypothetical protein PHSC3_000698 [Chlamydiales bacterium STE3]|nr:hypothetical protein PHSC3_000698 [Chlamydiales bacterium STE3]
MSTKIHVTVNALGNPISFLLTPVQVYNLEGADQLLPETQAEIIIADKAFDANERAIIPLIKAGKKVRFHQKLIVRNQEVMIRTYTKRGI